MDSNVYCAMQIPIEFKKVTFILPHPPSTKVTVELALDEACYEPREACYVAA